MSGDSTILTDFRSVEYPKIPQEETIEEFIKSVYYSGERKLSRGEIIKGIEKYAISEEKIKQRSVLKYSDFPNNWNDLIIDTLNNEYEGKKSPQGVVFATGTMFDIPSPLQRFISSKGWMDLLPYHSFNFGCAGAFPALEVSDSLVKNNLLELKALDIFNTDIISRHFDRLAGNLSQDLRTDGIIISTLFGDSSIFYTLMKEEEFYKQEKDGLKVLAFHRESIPDSVEATTWFDQIVAHFRLSALIPEYARDNFFGFVGKLCGKLGIDFEEQREDLKYALHPGGSKILDYIQEACGLSDDSIANSRKLLYENGNTSSVSCPTLWSQMVKDENIPYGSKIVSVGLGPGLMIGGAILEKVKSGYSK